MAAVYGIQKAVTLDSGLTFDHWGVCSVSLNPLSQSASIMLCGYKDFTARLTGKKPIPGQSIFITMTFAQLGLNAAMTNPLEELSNAVMDYAIANAEELSGGVKVSQSI